MVADVLRYLGHKMWQLQWMVAFLQTGEDRPVRHIRTSIAAYDREDEAGARRSDAPAPAD